MATKLTRMTRMGRKEMREIRKRLGYTQAELAHSLGVAGNTVWRWESGSPGKYPIPKSIASLLRLMAEKTQNSA